MRQLMRAPFWGVSNLRNELGRMYNDLVESNDALIRGAEGDVTFNPACDVKETEDHYLLSFDVPGVAKENMKIEVIDGVLHVSGERRNEQEFNKGAEHLIERTYGQFRRSFALPGHVDTAKVEAAYQDGVLSISIPKLDIAKPRPIKINDGRPSLFRRVTGNSPAKSEHKAA